MLRQFGVALSPFGYAWPAERGESKLLSGSVSGSESGSGSGSTGSKSES